MADVYDLFSKIKLNDGPSLEERLELCAYKTTTEGICSCAFCNFKRNLAEELIVNASKKMIEEMKKSKEAYYFYDLLESIDLAYRFLIKELNKQKRK